MTAIPEGLRSGELFKDGTELLSWTLQRIRYRIRTPFEMKPRDTEAANRYVGLAALLRANLANAHGVLAVARSEAPESAYPILRSMLELWADFNLAMRDETGANYRKMVVAGAIVAARLMPSSKKTTDMLGALERDLNAEFSEVSVRLGRRPYAHWSGMSRHKAIAEACGDQFSRMYEVWSLDTHAIVQVVFDREWMKEGSSSGTVTARHRRPGPVVARDVTLSAAIIIRRQWNALADYRGVQGRGQTELF
jgi:hypothetical protein